MVFMYSYIYTTSTIINRKTFRFNLSIAKSFNADYDGDEMDL